MGRPGGSPRPRTRARGQGPRRARAERERTHRAAQSVHQGSPHGRLLARGGHGLQPKLRHLQVTKDNL